MLAAAVASAVVGVNTEQIRDWLSFQDPISSSTQDADRPDSFSLVAPDSANLVRDVGSISECDDLWQAGLRSGASVVGERSERLVMQGKSRDGAVITGMRARVTGRGPAEGDALLTCPSAGADEPLGFSFDLSSPDDGPGPDRVEAVRHPIDPDESTDRLTQFADGFAISLKENEFVPLLLSTTLPEERITWVVDVDVSVDGELRTVTIDDDGRDFYSPGEKDQNDYAAGYTAGVEQATWGVDRTAPTVPGPDGRIRYRGLSIPAIDGLDVYQPLDGVAEQGKRWIRKDGRPVVEFNPPGSVPDLTPTVGALCGGWNDERAGLVRSTRLVGVRDSPTGSPGVRRFTTDAVCAGADETPTDTLRYESAVLPGGTVAATIVDDLAEADRGVATQILDGLAALPDLRPLDVTAAASVPNLPTDKHPRAPGIGPVTDVGVIASVHEDPRGLVIEFEPVDHTVCACPGGGRSTSLPGPPLRLIVPQFEATMTETVLDAEGSVVEQVGDTGTVVAWHKEKRTVVLNRTPAGIVTALAAAGVS